MDSNIKTLLIILVVILIVLGYMVKLTLDLDAKNLDCIDNPLIYGAKGLAHVNSAKFSCTCSLDKSNSPMVYFDSDSESLKVVRPYSNNPQTETNFTKIMEGLVFDYD